LASLEKHRPWDLIISDWSMPRFSAPAALDIVRKKRLDIPFIIVSGTIGEEAAVEAMRNGARDYVLKDKLNRLTPAVERELRECAARRARLRTEHALRESEVRFRRLYDSGIIGIMLANLDGRIIDANDAYLKMLGYTRDEVTRGHVRWTGITPPEFARQQARAIEELRSSGVATPWEMDVSRKDGVRVPLLMGAAMVEDPNCIAFAVDLTERRSSEHLRKRLVREAKKEQAARERAEIALSEREEQLRQAQKMEALGRLAGGVAHDFNNVLSVILSYGELILGELKPSDPLRSDIEEIRKAATRAAGLTRQLLLLSRQQVVERRVLDLNEVLLGMEQMLRRILGEDVELVVIAARSIGRVRADRTHIEQVILNLVVNARDAMPTGGKLTVETSNVVLDDAYAQNHPAVAAGQYVMMAVTDTGCGMDRAVQECIFEPFFTTKEPGKGTGLGLSTVFGIVQQSGGDISVDSEPGAGTTFKIHFPLVAAEADVIRPHVVPSTLRGNETILLVEDEEQVRTIARNILRKQGYRVLAAQHAGEALLLSERHAAKIDLLVTDVVMPQMSGPELAKRLASTRPEMKVLCMSGYTDDSIVRYGVLESGIAVLQKPLTPATLATKVREVLDEATSASTPEIGEKSPG